MKLKISYIPIPESVRSDRKSHLKCVSEINSNKNANKRFYLSKTNREYVK